MENILYILRYYSLSCEWLKCSSHFKSVKRNKQNKKIVIFNQIDQNIIKSKLINLKRAKKFDHFNLFWCQIGKFNDFP